MTGLPTRAQRENTMRMAHLYLFVDGCPSDWLTHGHEETWHTIVCVGFQSDPSLEALIANGADHNLALLADGAFEDLLSKLTTRSGRLQLSKWKKSEAYQRRFIDAFLMMAKTTQWRPSVNAYSFQEKTLRAAKPALLAEYNATRPDHDIGFVEFDDRKGRRVMKHEFVNFGGYHVLERLENQLLVLLLMAWAIADQYRFHRRAILDQPHLGFGHVALTVVSDTLSGDSDLTRDSEQVLKWLLDTDADTPATQTPITVTHSPRSDTHPGDLLADNLAGWLNAALQDPNGEYGRLFLESSALDHFVSWHEVLASTEKFVGRPLVAHLRALHAIPTK